MKSGYLFGMLASAIGVAVLAVSPAQAGRYLVTESQSNVLACYDKVYVPATVEYNTRGVLVQRGSAGWEITGDRWLHVRNPPVYLETRRVVEPDHYKLVPCQ